MRIGTYVVAYAHIFSICKYIFNMRIIRILIHADMRIMRNYAFLFRTAYVSAYTNKSKHLYFKTDFWVSDHHLT